MVYLRKRDWTIAAASAWTMSERRLEVEGQVVSFRRGRGVFVEVEVEEDWAEGGVGEKVSIMTIVVVVGVGVERLERGIECAYLNWLEKKFKFLNKTNCDEVNSAPELCELIQEVLTHYQTL